MESVGQLESLTSVSDYEELVKRDEESTIVLLATTVPSEAGTLMENCLSGYLKVKCLTLCKLNVELGAVAPLLEKLSIENVPAVLFIEKGSIVDRVVGYDPQSLISKLKFYSKSYVPGFEVAASLDDRLKQLINSSKIMAFIKGTKAEPFCKFSRELVGILNETQLDYNTFNVFADQEVREGLKKYSNWPTYPQVYVNGSLVGGLDIIKELKQSNELIETLNKAGTSA